MSTASGASGEYGGLVRDSSDMGAEREKDGMGGGRKSLSPLPRGKDGSLPSTAVKGSPLSSLEGKDGLSPLLHYPTPPEAPAGRQRVLAAHAAAGETSLSPSSYLFGKKRLRTQSMDLEEMREEEEEEEEEGDGGRRSLREGRRERKKERLRGDGVGEKIQRLFVAILSYDPEAMCTTGRPDLELPFDEG